MSSETIEKREVDLHPPLIRVDHAQGYEQEQGDGAESDFNDGYLSALHTATKIITQPTVG